MALRQTKKISELPSLSPASLDTTYVVGISGSTTYKISINQLTSSLDTTFATDIVTNALSGNINQMVTTSSFNTFSESVDSRILAATNEQNLTHLATTASNNFIGAQTITGSVSISGAAETDLEIQGRVAVMGATSRLAISASDSLNTITRKDITITSADVSGNVQISNQFGGYMVAYSDDGSELSITADNFTYSNQWNGPAIGINDPGNTYPAIIGFQNKSTWTDGRVTILKPLIVSSSVEIKGANLEITGSITVNGDLFLTDDGPITSLLFNKNYFTEFKGIAQRWRKDDGIVSFEMGDTKSEILLYGYSGSYDNGLIVDIDSEGTTFSDYNTTKVKKSWLKILPNLDNDPVPIFTRGVEVSGSITLNGELQFPDSTVQTTAFNGLPTGIVSSSVQLTSSFDGRYVLSGSVTGSKIVGSDTISKIETITSASYAAITPVSGTLYIIIG